MASYRKKRIDQRLVEEGLAPSRAQAADLVRRGRVLVAGEPALKPGATIADDIVLALAPGTDAHVSRGALKLAAALDAFEFSVEDRVALDVGASTGGFTEILLARGAAKVFAVDVGRDQLHASLRADPRVVSLEGTDARTIDESLVPETVAAIVADVSFISLTQALPAALSRAAPGAWLAALVKPQFEAGREAVGKGGLVRDEADRRRAVARVRDFLEWEGWRVLGVIESPIAGGSGNIEYLIGARHDR
ncbi:MAG: TlyA family rRNA (cytidine-2'-O)-methyltransferase [Methyloceanibacter sp.]|nr:MAG: TlyA family rRNA (cytidine-2'-O)-methyltransferase [Methyloceanibacter sp.]